MALIGLVCSCGHVGVVGSATLPRMITCSSCGYARRMDRTEGYEVRGWRRAKTAKEPVGTCGAGSPVNASHPGSAPAHQRPERTHDALHTAGELPGDDLLATLEKASAAYEAGQPIEDGHAAILAAWFAGRRA